MSELGLSLLAIGVWLLPMLGVALWLSLSKRTAPRRGGDVHGRMPPTAQS